MFNNFRKCIIKLNMLYLITILSFVHSTYSYGQERNVSSRNGMLSVKCTPEDEITHTMQWGTCLAQEMLSR